MDENLADKISFMMDAIADEEIEDNPYIETVEAALALTQYIPVASDI